MLGDWKRSQCFIKVAVGVSPQAVPAASSRKDPQPKVFTNNHLW